ncbi:neprilysin-like 11 [Cochliomyia hominivorax]
MSLYILLFCTALLATHSLAANFDKVAIEHDVLRFTYELESWLDMSKRPCDDFYGYVCTRTLNASNQAKYDRLLEQEQIKFNKFLESSNEDELLDSELKLKHFYESCKTARSTEQLKTTLMYRSVGGWPAIDDSPAMLRKRRNMTWLQVLSIFHETGIPYFFNTKIELISNKRIVQIQPDDSLQFTLRKFEQLAGEIMQLNNVDAGRARLVALEILNFERNSRDIMKISVGEQDKVREYSYADFKMLNFGSVYPLDWDTYFRKVMGKPLKPTDLIIVSEMPKLIQYFELLQGTTLTRFLNWLWIDYLMDKTPDDCKKLTETYLAPVYQHVVERTGIDKVQMAHMYSELGQQYEQLLANTAWIDEITQQNSKLFLERIMHLTLNGDAKLDNDYQALTITKRNFYRNLEKVQRFKAQQMKIDSSGKSKLPGSTQQVTQSAKEFMKVFLTINALIQQQQNLSSPLNYVMLGEYFSEVMIGGAYDTPGAWRSTDSDRKFEQFNRCLQRQESLQQRNYNLNNLLLKLLAQKQSWQTYQSWLQLDEAFVQRLNTLLSAGRLQLTMEKLYFVATTLVDCHLHHNEQRRQFIHTALKQTKEFQQTFKCQPWDSLYNNNKCLVL